MEMGLAGFHISSLCPNTAADTAYKKLKFFNRGSDHIPSSASASSYMLYGGFDCHMIY